MLHERQMGCSEWGYTTCSKHHETDSGLLTMQTHGAMPAKQTHIPRSLFFTSCSSIKLWLHQKLIKHLSTVKLTAESWRRELKRSFQVTAALRKASWRRMSCSTSSVWARAPPPSGSLEVISGSLAFSQASALTVSWTNWNFSCSSGDSRPTALLPSHQLSPNRNMLLTFLFTWWWYLCFLSQWMCNVSAHKKNYKIHTWFMMKGKKWGEKTCVVWAPLTFNIAMC